MEAKYELIPDTGMQVIDAREDHNFIEGTLFPTYEDLTDQKVLKNVRDVFKGFDYDPTESMGRRFTDVDSLTEYVQRSMDDIKSVRHRAEASEMLQRAAAIARFWYLGDSLDRALEEGSYGTGASNKLAAQLKVSVPYIYQIRAVSRKLTVTDCYLLGVRGCDSTMLRKLAQIKEDARRAAIIKLFVDTFKDTYDKEAMDAARKALTQAIDNENSVSPLQLNESGDGGALVGDSDNPPQFDAAINLLQQWQKSMKKLAAENFAEKTCEVFSNFYLTTATENADALMKDITAEGSRTHALIQSAIANLEDICEAIHGMMAVEPLDPENTK